jgi:hypothetical protein
MSGKVYVPAVLPTGKEPPITIRQEVHELWSLSGLFGVKKNLLPLPEIKPRSSSQ